MINLSIKEFINFCNDRGFTRYILSSENQEFLIRPSFVYEFNSVSGFEDQNIINFKCENGSWIQFDNVEMIGINECGNDVIFMIRWRKQSLPIWNLPMCAFVAKNK